MCYLPGMSGLRTRLTLGLCFVLALGAVGCRKKVPEAKCNEVCAHHQKLWFVQMPAKKAEWEAMSAEERDREGKLCLQSCLNGGTEEYAACVLKAKNWIEARTCLPEDEFSGRTPR
jgi:hypothetical protein